MVSPKGQDSDATRQAFRPGSARGDEIRPTAADRKQGDPQASGTQTPEQHVFGVKGDESILLRVVGGHCCHRMREIRVKPQVFMLRTFVDGDRFL